MSTHGLSDAYAYARIRRLTDKADRQRWPTKICMIYVWYSMICRDQQLSIHQVRTNTFLHPRNVHSQRACIRNLPTQQKPTLSSRLHSHTWPWNHASGQLPTQAAWGVPSPIKVAHSKKALLSWIQLKPCRAMPCAKCSAEAPSFTLDVPWKWRLSVVHCLALVLPIEKSNLQKKKTNLPAKHRHKPFPVHGTLHSLHAVIDARIFWTSP